MFSRARAELDQQDQRLRHKFYARQLGELASTITTGAITVDGVAEDPKKYEAVGVALYRSLLARPGGRSLENGGVEHGFRACARLAMWGAKAYQEHISGSARPARVEELQKILHASYEPAVSTFSKASHQTNSILETWFGLTNSYRPSLQGIPFDIVPDSTNKVLVLAPSPGVLTLAKLEAEQANPAAFTEGQRCPASGKMLKNVWAATINTCAANEHLFAADLAPRGEMLPITV